MKELRTKKAVVISTFVGLISFFAGSVFYFNRVTLAKTWNAQEIATCLRSPACHQTFVVGHRGRGFKAPDNSLRAVEKSVLAGVPVFETDIQLSRDGELFISHSEELDKTTSGKGRIQNFNAEELVKLHLTDGEKFPRFADMYQISAGRSLLILDFKANAVDKMARWITAHGSFDDVIFFPHSAEEIRAASEWKKKRPKMLVILNTQSLQQLETMEKKFGLRPEIIEVDPANKESIELFHRQGFKVYTKSRGAEFRFPIFRFFAINQVLAMHPDLILTDRPLTYIKH